MSFVEIIKILMSVLSLIIGLFNPKTGMRQVASITNADCAQVEWTVPPGVSGGVFSGTASVVCHFEGKGGGGIPALRAHMIQTIPASAQTGQMLVTSHQGLPSFSWDTQLEMGNNALVKGTTFIGANGSNFLRNVFESSSVQGSGSAQYLKNLYSAVEVTRLQDGSYMLRASQAMGVKKPLLMSSSKFISTLRGQAEEALLERAVNSVQEMASHL